MKRFAFAKVCIFLILLVVIAPGCSSEPSRYAATGTVTIDGAPASYVSVKFYPVSSSFTAGGSGPADKDGKFTIGGNGQNTGLPAGEYKVTFSQTLVGGKPTLAGGGGKKSIEETVPSEREAVAEEYRTPEKTPVTARIGSGENNFTFDIKAAK